MTVVPDRTPIHHAAPIPTFVGAGARRADEAQRSLSSDARFRAEIVDAERLITRVREEAAKRTPLVLVAGGDGTLGRAAQSLAGHGTALGVLPAGTRNHFARDMGIPLDSGGALDVALTGRVRTVDVGLANDRVFLNTGSSGGYIDFVRRRRMLDRLAGYHAASLLAAMATLGRYERGEVRLQLEGKHIRYDASLVVVAVGERALAPPLVGGRRPDGARELHVFVVHERSRRRLIDLMVRAERRGIASLSDETGVHAFLVDSLELELPRRDGRVALDGELVSVSSPLSYRLLRDALHVVVPRPP